MDGPSLRYYDHVIANRLTSSYAYPRAIGIVEVFGTVMGHFHPVRWNHKAEDDFHAVCVYCSKPVDYDTVSASCEHVEFHPAIK